MSVFVPCEGGVYKHVDANCQKGCNSCDIAVITVDDLQTLTVPITGFMLEMSTNHQFLHSLDEFIYVYAFGDRVGELIISGIAFTECVTTGPGATASGHMDSLYAHYLRSRLAKNLTPTKITLGSANTELLGFLTGMRLEVPNPQLPIAQWVLRYQVILNSPVAAGAFAGAGSDEPYGTLGGYAN